MNTRHEKDQVTETEFLLQVRSELKKLEHDSFYLRQLNSQTYSEIVRVHELLRQQTKLMRQKQILCSSVITDAQSLLFKNNNLYQNKIVPLETEIAFIETERTNYMQELNKLYAKQAEYSTQQDKLQQAINDKKNLILLMSQPLEAQAAIQTQSWNSHIYIVNESLSDQPINSQTQPTREYKSPSEVSTRKRKENLSITQSSAILFSTDQGVTSNKKQKIVIEIEDDECNDTKNSFCDEEDTRNMLLLKEYTNRL